MVWAGARSPFVHEVAGKDGLFSLLVKMIQHVLPELDEEGVCEILRKRLRQPTMADLLVENTEEVQDLIEHADLKEAKAVVKEAAQEAAEKQPFADEYRAYARKVVAAKRARAKAKGKAKGRGRGNGQTPRRAIRMGEVDEGITQERVQSLLPHGHRVWRDAFCCRWQWTLHGAYMGSRSWRKYGYAAAAQSIVNSAWTHEVRLGWGLVRAQRHVWGWGLRDVWAVRARGRGSRQVWVGNDGPDFDLGLPGASSSSRS